MVGDEVRSRCHEVPLESACFCVLSRNTDNWMQATGHCERATYEHFVSNHTVDNVTEFSRLGGGRLKICEFLVQGRHRGEVGGGN